MSNVQFEEPQHVAYRPKVKGLEGVVVSLGLAKNKKQAQMVLLGAAIVAVIIAFVAPMVFGGSGGVQGPVPQGTSETVPG